MSAGSIRDSAGTLSLQNNNLTTTGQLQPASLKTGTLTVAAGSVVDTSGLINLGSTALRTTAQMHASDFLALSDQRLKKDVVPLQLSLADLAKLKPSRFTWKQTDLADIGLIAQDVQSVLPEVVKEDDFLMVDYSKIAPALITWVQLLAAKVAALEAKSP